MTRDAATTSGATAAPGRSRCCSATAASSTASCPTSPTRPPSTPARPTPTASATTSARWPRWRAEWRVTGPRKDYGMVSRFRPASADEAARCALALAARRLRRCRPATRGPRSGRAAAADARLPRRPGAGGRPARSSIPAAASSSSRTTTATKPYAWLLVPSTDVTGIEDPAVFEAPVAGFWQIGWQVGAPAGAGAARGARPRDQLGGRPQPEPAAHPRLLRAARGPRGARGRADRPGLGRRAVRRARAASASTPAASHRLEPSPFLLLRDLPGAAEDMGEQSLGGDRRRRRRLLPPDRLDRARRRRPRPRRCSTRPAAA